MIEPYKAGDDKFAESDTTRLPEQIQWKLYRAKQHFMEFERVAADWMNSGEAGPGRFVHAPESTVHNRVFIYAPEKPMLARFGLIAGDYLQNLRSVLDYMVWDMILAAGKVPNEKLTAFPVCGKPKSFKLAKKCRLLGLPTDAIDLIEKLQPYSHTNIGPSTLYILDELNNRNKQRRVLSTSLATMLKPAPPAEVLILISNYRSTATRAVTLFLARACWLILLLKAAS